LLGLTVSVIVVVVVIVVGKVEWDDWLGWE